MSMMKRSGSNRRKRQYQLCIRFNGMEEAAIRARAEKAGTPVAALIRSAVLEQPATRAARRPTVNQHEVARLIGVLGTIAETLRKASSTGAIEAQNPYISAALRDLAEMRYVCIQAMGRK